MSESTAPTRNPISTLDEAVMMATRDLWEKLNA